MSAVQWRAGLTALAVIIGTVWLGGALSTLLTGVPDPGYTPNAPAVPGSTGEANLAQQAQPRTVVRKASRSRSTPEPVTGTHLPLVLQRIRDCESGNDYTAENPRSTASGAFQILDGTWNRFGGYRHAGHAPRRVQDAKALALYADRGTRPWNASRWCWA